MAKRSKMTFEKRRREMEKKKKRAEKLGRKHEGVEHGDIPDPLDVFREYEAETGDGRDWPEEEESGTESDSDSPTTPSAN